MREDVQINEWNMRSEWSFCPCFNDLHLQMSWFTFSREHFLIVYKGKHLCMLGVCVGLKYSLAFQTLRPGLLFTIYCS